MPRKRIQKTNRASRDLAVYESAYDAILLGISVRAAAAQFDLCHVSLLRYKKKREDAVEGSAKVTMGYRPANRVFSVEQENEMVIYIKKAADIYQGLSPREIRKMALQLATKYNLNKPDKWIENGLAGEDWFSGFMARHPDLSIRAPQATSLSNKLQYHK